MKHATIAALTLHCCYRLQRSCRIRDRQDICAKHERRKRIDITQGDTFLRIATQRRRHPKRTRSRLLGRLMRIMLRLHRYYMNLKAYINLEAVIHGEQLFTKGHRLPN
jgi:hypothetical protein